MSRTPPAHSRDDRDPALRVLFATNHKHLPQAVAGLERTTDELCQGLAAEGVPCAVLAAIAPDDLLGLRTRALAKAVGWSRVPPDRSPGYPVYRRWSPADAVPQIKARFGPSVAVVMAGAPGALLDVLLANAVPTIWYILDVEPETLIPQPPARQGLSFLACSAFVAARAKQVRGIDAAVIPPIVDAQRYRVETSRRSVVFVNPSPQKGVEIAIRLAELRPDIPFEFFEAWNDAGTYAPYRARTAARANIAWHKATRDIRQIYRRGRVLLAPSQWNEGWGRVVSEAQASGIPVLASRRGGLPEAVGAGGILVDAESDIAAWQAALARLWDDGDAYAGCCAAAFAHAARPELDGARVLAAFKDHLRDHCRRAASAGWR